MATITHTITHVDVLDDLRFAVGEPFVPESVRRVAIALATVRDRGGDLLRYVDIHDVEDVAGVVAEIVAPDLLPKIAPEMFGS